jgi:hypothetical protein
VAAVTGSIETSDSCDIQLFSPIEVDCVGVRIDKVWPGR